MRMKKERANESSDLVRTFNLVSVIELLLKSAIDHVGETILSGSRVRDIGLSGSDIDIRRRLGLGVNGGDGSQEYEEIANEEESHEYTPHCSGFSERK